jgi:hypothetical protein
MRRLLGIPERLSCPHNKVIVGGAMVVGAIVLLQLKREHDELAPVLIRPRSDNAEIVK